MIEPFITSRALVQRLERVEAHANRAFVQARARISPAVGAAWLDVDGTWAMFDGVGSPITQTFGLGTFGQVTEAQLDSIEAFFAERGAEVAHEIATTSDMSLLPLLSGRGYRPIEWSSVMIRPMSLPFGTDSSLTVRRIESGEVGRWADVSARGWGETPELEAFIRGFGEVSAAAADSHAFLVEQNGQAIATGNLHLHEGVALLAGASTVPSYRRRGAQNALLDARITYAMQQGCDLAMVVTAPGSGSQHNAQRNGFQIAYSRVKFAKS